MLGKRLAGLSLQSAECTYNVTCLILVCVEYFRIQNWYEGIEQAAG